jgi:hypothetical protein
MFFDLIVYNLLCIINLIEIVFPFEKGSHTYDGESF